MQDRFVHFPGSLGSAENDVGTTAAATAATVAGIAAIKDHGIGRSFFFNLPNQLIDRLHQISLLSGEIEKLLYRIVSFICLDD